MENNNTERVAAEIARRLREYKPFPKQMILELVEIFGTEQTLTWMKEALRIEAEGGMITEKGNRKRTLGGIFFYLARQAAPGTKAEELFQASLEGRGKRPPRKTPEYPIVEVEEEQALETTQAMRKELAGKIGSIKLTITGRPLKLLKTPKYYIAVLIHNGHLPYVAKGLPKPPQSRVYYVIYMTYRQWDKVALAIENPDDLMIVEGMCTFDPTIKKVVVFATNTSTQFMERRKARRRKEIVIDENFSEEEFDAMPEPPPTPAELVRRQIEELRAKEQKAKGKIEKINALPFSQRKELPKVVRELHETQAQIQQLEEQITHLSYSNHHDIPTPP
jgi:hypothetical protein